MNFWLTCCYTFDIFSVIHAKIINLNLNEMINYFLFDTLKSYSNNDKDQRIFEKDFECFIKDAWLIL